MLLLFPLWKLLGFKSLQAESNSKPAGVWGRDLTIDLLLTTITHSASSGFVLSEKMAFPQALKQSRHLGNTGGVKSLLR